MDQNVFSVENMKWLFLATLIIFLVELFAKRLKNANVRDYAVTLACILANSFVFRPVAAILMAAAISIALPVYQGVLAEMPLWIATILVLVIAEFSFYWMHRLAHENASSKRDWLWRVHRTHHSAKELDVTVTMRQNISWAFLVPTSWVLGGAIYLGLVEAAALVLLIIYGWNLFTHTNFCWDEVLLRNRYLRGPIRALQHIVVTPMMHHTHHGFGGKNGKMYRNYAVMLSIFDFAFGTLHLPDARPAKYGIPGGQPHWAEEIFFPLFWSRKN